MRTIPTLLAVASLALTCALGLARTSSNGPAAPLAAQDPRDEKAALSAFFTDAGIRVDFESEAIAIETKMIVTNDLLEYVLVGAEGSAHESLLLTEVTPSLIHAALLAVGVEQGKNAEYHYFEPAPTEEEMRAGAKRVWLELPSGDGIFLYLAWREGEEIYFVRVEDVINDSESGRTMRRHRWTYIGSRFAKLRADSPEVYMADVEQNLINLAFFTEGNTLCTASLPECERQTIWMANSWVLPPPGESVRLILSHERLESIPASLAEALPEPDRKLEARNR